jgi:hypothetical protein
LTGFALNAVKGKQSPPLTDRRPAGNAFLTCLGDSLHLAPLGGRRTLASSQNQGRLRNDKEGDCHNQQRTLVSQQLCRLSRMNTILLPNFSTPGLICMHHCVQNNDQLTHTCCQCHLFFFSSSEQIFIEFPDPRIVFFSRQSRHV